MQGGGEDMYVGGGGGRVTQTLYQTVIMEWCKHRQVHAEEEVAMHCDMQRASAETPKAKFETLPCCWSWLVVLSHSQLAVADTSSEATVHCMVYAANCKYSCVLLPPSRGATTMIAFWIFWHTAACIRVMMLLVLMPESIGCWLWLCSHSIKCSHSYSIKNSIMSFTVTIWSLWTWEERPKFPDPIVLSN